MVPVLPLSYCPYLSGCADVPIVWTDFKMLHHAVTFSKMTLDGIIKH